ncbi:MAG: hypothetical protein AABY15_07635 [Nanoarchaeota archaeon]
MKKKKKQLKRQLNQQKKKLNDESMTLRDFYNKYKGQKNVGNTPENRGECVGLASLWMDVFNIPHVYGHAQDLYKNAKDADFAKIPNTPDAIIQDGDIPVWGHGFNGTFGHTGIAYGNHDVNNFDCFEQNDPLGSTSHIKRYNYAYVIGWLRPKNLPQSQDTVSKEKYDIDIASRDNQIKERDEQIKVLEGKLSECENKPPISDSEEIVPTLDIPPEIPPLQPEFDPFTELLRWIARLLKGSKK